MIQNNPIQSTEYPPHPTFGPTPRTITDIINRGDLPHPNIAQLPPPPYVADDPEHPHPSTINVALAVESMRSHMSDEGWQIMQGLQHNRYLLVGYGLSMPYTDIPQILERFPGAGIYLIQDKREWDVPQTPNPTTHQTTRDFRDPNARFTNVECLASRPDIFKLTILKDAHQKPTYHAQSAQEMGVHAWVINYHPRIVQHVAPYVRPQHLIRTYHTLDPNILPHTLFTTVSTPDNPHPPKGMYQREGCIVSGAISSTYPLRQRIASLCNQRVLPHTRHLQHPGYHRSGCCTPQYMKVLSKHKVAICTSSIYGYALRKIIEATACGCVVLTDLPQDETLPFIDNNLARIHPDISTPQLVDAIQYLMSNYNPERQRYFSDMAIHHYDYRVVCRKLADDIQNMRQTYNHSLTTDPTPG